MENIEKEKLVLKTIEKIRPYLQADGGDVEFVKLEDDIVYVRVMGACIGCSALSETLKDGVGALILDEVEGIKDVRLDTSLDDQYNQELLDQLNKLKEEIDRNNAKNDENKDANQ